MKNAPNPLRLGKRQKRILKDMCINGNVIRVVLDYRRHDYSGTEICLCSDEDGENDYEKITYLMLQSLWQRHLFSRTERQPSVEISIITYRIKLKIKQELLLHL